MILQCREDKPWTSDRSHPTTMVSYLKTWLGLMDMWLGMVFDPPHVDDDFGSWFIAAKIAAEIIFLLLLWFHVLEMLGICVYSLDFCLGILPMGFITILFKPPFGRRSFFNCSKHRTSKSKPCSGFHANKTHHFQGKHVDSSTDLQLQHDISTSSCWAVGCRGSKKVIPT